MGKAERKTRASRRASTDYVTPGRRSSEMLFLDAVFDTHVAKQNDTTTIATNATDTTSDTTITNTPVERLSHHHERLLAYYGAFFASSRAMMLTRDMYLKIAFLVCSLTGTEINKRYWYRGFCHRNKTLLNNKDAANDISTLVQLSDSFKMDEHRRMDDGKLINLHSATVETKMAWLKKFLEDTHRPQLRLLFVPYHSGLEEFVAQCIANNVIVFHEGEATVCETNHFERVIPSVTAESCDSSRPSESSTSSDVMSDIEDSPESADTDDTITELPCSQLVLVRRQHEDEPSAESGDLLQICKNFSEKALTHPSGDILKLLEHTLEERNKLILKVVSMEMELKAARGY